MYVDDVLVGFHSVDTALKAKAELIAVTSSAGFELRKWTSNHKKILADLPSDHLLHKDFLDFDDSSVVKTLGIRWNALSDVFYFSAKPFATNHSFTKRQILSEIAKLFDPAGWLAPCIILAKIIMQHIWLEHSGWDDDVSVKIQNDWARFQSNFITINEIKIPRWLGFSPKADVQFHGFCDASEQAYAPALYIRLEYMQKIQIHLVSSITKVAPCLFLALNSVKLYC